MGDHSQNLRRAAVHHRRLADGDFFQNLAPRFSPTAIFTTWDTNTIPQPSSPGKFLHVVCMLKKMDFGDIPKCLALDMLHS
jgi:hypothetical protein